MNNDLKTFAACLKALCARTGISQSELSRRIDVGPSDVNRYLKGTQGPTFPTLLALRDEFDCTWNELLGDPMA